MAPSGPFLFLESGGVDEPSGFDKIAGSDFGQRSWPGARSAEGESQDETNTSHPLRQKQKMAP